MRRRCPRRQHLAVSCWRANGRGLVGMGCVAAVTSPGTSLRGKRRYSTGKSDFPVTRSNRKMNPCFVVCATASIVRPPCVTVTRLGGDGRSRSQMSWRTVWKCHSRLPVAAFSAMSEFAIEVVARPVRAVEVGRAGSGRHVDDAAGFVERHAGPVVGAAVVFPRVLRPCLVPGFAGTRDGVERPSQLAGPRVIGPDVAGRRGQAFRYASADDQQIAIDDRRASSAGRIVSADRGQIVTQIDPPARAETSRRFAGPRVERIHVARNGGEQAPVVAAPSNTSGRGWRRGFRRRRQMSSGAGRWRRRAQTPGATVSGRRASRRRRSAASGGRPVSPVS